MTEAHYNLPPLSQKYKASKIPALAVQTDRQTERQTNRHRFPDMSPDFQDVSTSKTPFGNVIITNAFDRFLKTAENALWF